MPGYVWELTMATTTPARHLTLDDLDRDELLNLVRHTGLLWRPADLVWAQWEVASDRWNAAWDEYRRLGAEVHEAVVASIAATNALVAAACDPDGSIKTVSRLRRAAQAASTLVDQARDREDRARAKAARLGRRREAAYALYQELSR